jgi:hypothetical protein
VTRRCRWRRWELEPYTVSMISRRQAQLLLTPESLSRDEQRLPSRRSNGATRNARQRADEPWSHAGQERMPRKGRRRPESRQLRLECTDRNSLRRSVDPQPRVRPPARRVRNVGLCLQTIVRRPRVNRQSPARLAAECIGNTRTFGRSHCAVRRGLPEIVTLPNH